MVCTMATKTELIEYIKKIDEAIIHVTTYGTTQTLDLLGTRQTVTLTSVGELVKLKKHYEAELLRVSRNNKKGATRFI